MLFRNLSFLPPVRKSYFERAATKTRLNQFREGTPRECRAFSRCARHSLRCTMARLCERGQRLPPGPLRPWRARHPPTGFPEISPRSIRLQWSLAYCQTTPSSQSTRRTTTMPPREIGRYISTPQALLVGPVVGPANRGQRRVEGPPFGLDQFGLDSHVTPDLFRFTSGAMK